MWALGSYFRMFSRFDHSNGTRKQLLALFPSLTRAQNQSGRGKGACVRTSLWTGTLYFL